MHDQSTASKVNVGSLMAFQLFSRLLTFALNNVILRMCSPAVLGVASIKLELFIGTILSLSRDGVRTALLRYRSSRSEHEDEKLAMRMSWISMAFSLVFLSVLMTMFRWNIPHELNTDLRLRSQYQHSLSLYGFSALVEICGEPFVISLLRRQATSRRLKAELQSIVLRMLTIITSVFIIDEKNDMSLGMKAFTYGQLIRSFTLTIGLALAQTDISGSSWRQALPWSSGVWDWPTFRQACDLSRPILYRTFLAQGDMWIIGMSALEDQGLYSVAVNYGSLVCRILLQPLEESGLQYFARAFTTKDTNTKQEALNHFAAILKFYLLLSLVVGLVAPSFTDLVVHFLLGRRWTGTKMASVLSAYCMQIPFMAFCGIFEAFINATLTADWYRCNEMTPFIATFFYGISAKHLMRKYDTVGLIAAGMVAFGFRAVFGLVYLRSFMNANKDLKLWKADLSLKKRTMLILISVAALCVKFYDPSIKTQLQFGLPAGITILGTVLLFERPLLKSLYSIITGKQGKAKIS